MADAVTSTLLYFVPPADGAHPYSYVNADPATGERRRNWTQVRKEVQITNLRGKENSVTLDSAGFQHYVHESAHKKFTDDNEITREYYPESEALLKKLTGASHVVLFDHTIRRRRPGMPDMSPDKRQPALNVHVDQTPQSAERRVHMHAPERAADISKHRFQIINLWRPISRPAVDYPLALCDYRSIDYKNDLVHSTLKFPERDGETFSVKYNPAHRWSYFRGMNTDEILLIKCFDSKIDEKVAVLTPHTAFVDPTTPKDAPLRESIELRALLFYDTILNNA